jgi:hypothetical protein
MYQYSTFPENATMPVPISPENKGLQTLRALVDSILEADLNRDLTVLIVLGESKLLTCSLGALILTAVISLGVFRVGRSSFRIVQLLGRIRRPAWCSASCRLHRNCRSHRTTIQQLGASLPSLCTAKIRLV